VPGHIGHRAHWSACLVTGQVPIYKDEDFLFKVLFIEEQR